MDDTELKSSSTEEQSRTRPTFELVDYIAVFKRSRWLIVLTTLVAAIAGIALPLLTPSSYESEALLVVEPVPALEQSGIAGATAGNLPTLAELAGTSVVEDLVLRNLEGQPSDPKHLKISQPTDQLLKLSYTSRDPQESRTVVQAYAESLVELRRGFLSDRLDKVRTIIQDRIGELSEQVEATSDDTLRVARVLELDALKNSLEEVHPGLVELGSGYVASELDEPRLSSTTPLKGGLAGMVIGLALGLLIAFVGEFARRMSVREDLS